MNFNVKGKLMTELRHELGIIALESCKELGNAIDKLIQKREIPMNHS